MKYLLIAALSAALGCSEDAADPEVGTDATESADGSTLDSSVTALDAEVASPDAAPEDDCTPDACPEAPLDAQLPRPEAGLDGAIDGGAAADAANDAGAPTDAGADGPRAADAAPISCAEAWATAENRVEAAARPNDPGMRLSFTYGRQDANAWISLDRIDGERVVRDSDGPFSVEENSGSWVELHDADGATLYTRGVFELIAESVEVPPGGDAGFMRFSRCPDGGFIRLQNLPNDRAATHVVFYQSAIDGEPGGPTVEVARFALP